MPLLAAVVSGFNGRFEKCLSLSPEVTDAVIATVTLPYFKLRWVTLWKGPNFVNQETLKFNYKNTLQQAVSRISTSENEASYICNNSKMTISSIIWKELLPPLTTSDLEVLYYLQDTSIYIR